MATATSHTQARFPPSPPPSPPTRKRHHKKKHSDPFDDLDQPLYISLPSPGAQSENEKQEQESLFTRVILTPIYFTSFLLSLFLVNRSDRARRLANGPAPSLFAYLNPSAWLDPEPYQDPDNGTWERRGSFTHVEPHAALNPGGVHASGGGGGEKKKKGSWYLRKKIRKVARVEIGDAFEMRRRVIVMMFSALALVCWAVFLGMRWVVRKVW